MQPSGLYYTTRSSDTVLTAPTGNSHCQVVFAARDEESDAIATSHASGLAKLVQKKMKNVEVESRARPESIETATLARVQGIIFDVDGTLYDQSTLRRRLTSDSSRACSVRMVGEDSGDHRWRDSMGG